METATTATHSSTTSRCNRTPRARYPNRRRCFSSAPALPPFRCAAGSRSARKRAHRGNHLPPFGLASDRLRDDDGRPGIALVGRPSPDSFRGFRRLVSPRQPPQAPRFSPRPPRRVASITLAERTYALGKCCSADALLAPNENTVSAHGSVIASVRGTQRATRHRGGVQLLIRLYTSHSSLMVRRALPNAFCARASSDAGGAHA